jgi:hypothetical protein
MSRIPAWKSRMTTASPKTYTISFYQIPPDLVVKTQAIDIVEVVSQLLRRSDAV